MRIREQRGGIELVRQVDFIESPPREIFNFEAKLSRSQPCFLVSAAPQKRARVAERENEKWRLLYTTKKKEGETGATASLCTADAATGFGPLMTFASSYSSISPRPAFFFGGALKSNGP